MTDLPPDPRRLREIQAYLEQQVAETEAVCIYLRLQRDAVRRALAEADAPAPQRPPPPRPSPEPKPEAAPSPDGYVFERRWSPKSPRAALIHTAACSMPQHPTVPATVDEVRLALKDPSRPALIEPCQHCRPDTELARG